jgi:hypothetical protein
MSKHTITTRRRTIRSRRWQPHPGRGGLAALFLPGLRVAWRAFWHDVAYPRLVGGVALLFPALALLVLLAHLALAETTGLWRPGPTTPKPAPSPSHQCPDKAQDQHNRTPVNPPQAPCYLHSYVYLSSIKCHSLVSGVRTNRYK